MDRAGELGIPGRSYGPRRALWLLRRSTTFERATPRVLVTVFTGYLPEAASATAMSSFLPGQDRAPPLVVGI